MDFIPPLHMCHAAVLMSQVCVLPVAVVNLWIQVRTCSGLLTHQHGLTVNTLGRGKVCCLLVFPMVLFQRCQHQKPSSSQSFKEIKLCGFFQSESRYPAIAPLLYTGASKMAAAKSTCGKACSHSLGKTALCVTFPLLHSHCKKKKDLFLFNFFSFDH